MSKILVLRFSAFGDVAMTVPVIASAAKLSPSDEFTVASRVQYAPLFRRLGPNVNFWGVDLKSSRYSGIFGMLKLYKDMSRHRFDIVVDLHDVIRTKLLRALFAFAGVKVTSIDKERAKRRAAVRDGGKRLLPLATSFQRYAIAFAKAGIKSDDSFVSLYQGQQIEEPVLPQFAGQCQGKRCIGIAPFSKHQSKQLPLATTRTVVESLASDGANHVFLFGSDGNERAELEAWAEGNANVTSVAGKLSLDEELQLMSKLDCMLSMDSANMHLASLVAVPVVSVWGATHPLCGFMGWKQPLGNAVQLDMSCRPCSVFGQKKCRYGTYDCLAGITPQMLLDKIHAVTGSQARASSARSKNI